MRKLLFSLTISLLVFIPALASTPGRSIEPVDQPEMILGTVDVPPQVEAAVLRALTDGDSVLPAAYQYAAVTDLRPAGDWLFVSVVALADLESAPEWRLDDAIWAGLVLLQKNGEGWSGAVEGTVAFSQLLRQVPSDILDQAAQESIDPLQRSVNTEPYIFPWEEGFDMLYGARGVHSADFSHLIPGWKAVDFWSDGNTAVLNAPNRLLAAGSGTISYVCRDSVNVAIRVEGLFYVHLVDNPGLYIGSSFDQGEELGQLQTGSFSENCGWAVQSAGSFHVHWGFPDTGTFEAGGWTLDLTDELWRRGDEVQGVGDWFRAEPLDFTIQGRVTDHNLSPVGGVTITHQSGISATTDISGSYAFTFTHGTHTLTPSYPNHVFWPPQRALEVPPDLVGQDFIMLAEPVTATLYPTASAYLIYTDTQGLTTTAEIPLGAVSTTTVMTLTPMLASSGGGIAFAGHAFELDAVPADQLRSGLAFSLPVTVTVRYSELDVRLVTDTNQLMLNWRGNDGWELAAGTCDPPLPGSHDPVQRVLAQPICSTGPYVLFGPTNQAYLPLVLRNS